MKKNHTEAKAKDVAAGWVAGIVSFECRTRDLAPGWFDEKDE